MTPEQMIPLLRDYSLRAAFAFNPHISFIFLSKSLPFYKAKYGDYVHRVRSGAVHLWRGVPDGTSYRLWCGMGGHASKGTLLAAPDPHDVVCATCEGRAIGSGLLGTPTIAGKVVRFSPRTAAALRAMASCHCTSATPGRSGPLTINGAQDAHPHQPHQI